MGSAWRRGGGKRYVPFDNGDDGRQDQSKLLEQMGAVTSLLELLNYTDNNLVIDTLGVDLCDARLAAW